MNHHQNALEALAQLSHVAGQIDTAECKDEGLYNRLQSALAVANASLDDAMKALAAAPQVVADELAYTAEEAREQFMDQVRHLVGYWERESRAPTAKEKLEGLAFSIMNIFDGTSGLPAFDIVCSPHPDDKQYCIDEGSKYFAPGMVINDCHLHEMLFSGRAATPVQAQEPVDWQKIALFYQDLYSKEKHRAPVQPVAVPDGWIATIANSPDKPVFTRSRFMPIKRDAEVCAEQWRKETPFYHVEVIGVFFAAPAAQGDAKDAERLVIEEKAQEIYSTWQSQPEFVAWQHGGNSHMQERARDMARVVIAAKAAS